MVKTMGDVARKTSRWLQFKKKKKQGTDAFGCNLNCKNPVRAKGFRKTGEHTRMKRKRRWVGLCACVCCARPGYSQAYNYTVVGVKLITEA